MKNKHPHHHIRKHLDKGKTFDFIKKELKLLGYEEKHIKKIIGSYLINHHFAKPIVLSIIPLLFLVSLLFIEPTITGNVVFVGSCVPKWECSGWDPPRCPPSGIQTRICTAIERCGSVKPIETRRCVHIAEISDEEVDETAVSPSGQIVTKKPTLQQIVTQMASQKQIIKPIIISEITPKPLPEEIPSPEIKEVLAPITYMRYQLILLLVIILLTSGFIYHANRASFMAADLKHKLVQLDELSKSGLEIEKYITQAKLAYFKIYKKYLKIIKLPRRESGLVDIYNKIRESQVKLIMETKSYELNVKNKLTYCDKLMKDITDRIDKPEEAAVLYSKLFKTYIELTKQNINKRRIRELYKRVLQVYKTLGR